MGVELLFGAIFAAGAVYALGVVFNYREWRDHVTDRFVGLPFWPSETTVLGRSSERLLVGWTVFVGVVAFVLTSIAVGAVVVQIATGTAS
jgi:hypothetical protein